MSELVPVVVRGPSMLRHCRAPRGVHRDPVQGLVARTFTTGVLLYGVLVQAILFWAGVPYRLPWVYLGCCLVPFAAGAASAAGWRARVAFLVGLVAAAAGGYRADTDSYIWGLAIGATVTSTAYLLLPQHRREASLRPAFPA